MSEQPRNLRIKDHEEGPSPAQWIVSFLIVLGCFVLFAFILPDKHFAIGGDEKVTLVRWYVAIGCVVGGLYGTFGGPVMVFYGMLCGIFIWPLCVLGFLLFFLSSD